MLLNYVLVIAADSVVCNLKNVNFLVL